jgi:hypothetical protein
MDISVSEGDLVYDPMLTSVSKAATRQDTQSDGFQSTIRFCSPSNPTAVTNPFNRESVWTKRSRNALLWSIDMVIVVAKMALRDTTSSNAVAKGILGVGRVLLLGNRISNP